MCAAAFSPTGEVTLQVYYRTPDEFTAALPRAQHRYGIRSDRSTVIFVLCPLRFIHEYTSLMRNPSRKVHFHFLCELFRSLAGLLKASSNKEVTSAHLSSVFFSTFLLKAFRKHSWVNLFTILDYVATPHSNKGERVKLRTASTLSSGWNRVLTAPDSHVLVPSVRNALN